MKDSDRRQFMRSLAVAGSGFAALQLASTKPGIQRAASQDHKFKFSLAAYSYRDLLKAGTLTLTDFINDCAEMQLDGAELTSYYFPDKPDDKLLRSMKFETFRRGLDVSGTAIGNDFCHPEGKTRDQQLRHVKDWIRRADLMDAPVIRVFSGKAHKGQTTKEAQRLAVAGIEECCEVAAEHGVFLALENHGGLTANVDQMLGLVKAVKSPWFGVNLDTGNFHSADVYSDLAKIAPYALNVQVKVNIRPAGGTLQPSDFDRLADILEGSGYRGYIVLEYEGSGDPRKECPRYIDRLRQAFT